MNLKSIVDGAVDVGEAALDTVAPEFSPLTDLAASGIKDGVSHIGGGSGDDGSGGDSSAGVPTGMGTDVADTGGDGSGQAYSTGGLDPNSAYSAGGTGGGMSSQQALQFQNQLDQQDEAFQEAEAKEKMRHSEVKEALQAAGS